MFWPTLDMTFGLEMLVEMSIPERMRLFPPKIRNTGHSGIFHLSRADEIGIFMLSFFTHCSWHEMGVYDIPAVLNFVLTHTGQPDLYYVGHSMGTTMFFVSFDPSSPDSLST